MEEKLCITIQQMPPRKIISKREEIALSGLDAFIRRSAEDLEREGGGACVFSIYHCPVTPEQAGIVEVCRPLGEAKRGNIRQLAGGEAAAATLTLAQSRPPEIIDCFRAVRRWIETQRRTIAGPPQEHYLSSAEGERIRIVWPLAPEIQPSPNAAL